MGDYHSEISRSLQFPFTTGSEAFNSHEQTFVGKLPFMHAFYAQSSERTKSDNEQCFDHYHVGMNIFCSNSKPEIGGWHWWGNTWPPLKSVLSSKIYNAPEYSNLRERLRRPAVAPTVTSSTSAGFVTVDIHGHARDEIQIFMRND